MKGLFKASLIVAAFNLTSLILGFIQNLIFASKFGAGFELDCYLTAITVPSYFITILAGSLSVCFIPIFTDIKDADEKASIFKKILFSSLVVGLVISLSIIVFAPYIIQLISPGFTYAMQSYCSKLLRIYSIIILFTIINELYAGFFFTKGEFLVPTINKLISPAIVIGALFFIKNITSECIIYANIIGVFIQTMALMIKYLASNTKPQAVKYVSNRDIFKFYKLMVPLIIGSLFYKFLPVFDKYLLSTLPAGSISIINFSQKLFIALSQVLGAILSMQVFSYMSTLASDQKFDDLGKLINNIIRIIVFISVPIVVTGMLYSNTIIAMIYQHGKLTAHVALIVAQCFNIYLLALPVTVIGTIVSQGLYVLKDTKSPMYVGFMEVAIYIILSILLVNYLKIRTLPVTYVIYFYFSVIILGAILNRKLHIINLLELGWTILKYIILIGVVVISLNLLIQDTDSTLSIQMLKIGITVTTYFGASYFLKFSESQILIKKFINEARPLIQKK